jgi:hypothetical protein
MLYPLDGVASITNGASAMQQLEAPGNRVNTVNIVFVQAAQSFWEIGTVMPSDYDGGTVTAKFYWDAADASTNAAVWGCQGRAYTDGDTLDQAYGTAQEVTDANNGNGKVNQSAATPAITLAGVPAAEKFTQIRVYRLGSGADNLAAPANLIAVALIYTRI